MIKKWFLSFFLYSFILGFVHAQYNPAEDQDALMERQKVLKAANQVEVLDTQMASLREESAQMQASLDTLQKELADLKQQNATLREQLIAFKAENDKQKKAMIDEVSTIVSKNSKSADAAVEAVKKKAGPPEGEYVVHTVAKGETMWLIAKAYSESGIKTSVPDICKANNITANTTLKVGQQLYIPKK